MWLHVTFAGPSGFHLNAIAWFLYMFKVFSTSIKVTGKSHALCLSELSSTHYCDGSQDTCWVAEKEKK